MNMLESVKDTLHNAGTAIGDFFMDDICVTRKSLLTIGSACALLGIIWGFILSPIKKGIYINISNNGNGNPCQDDE